MTVSIRIIVGFCALSILAACGQPFASPNAPGAPCPVITQAAYDEALKDGAVKARAVYGAGGSVSLTIGAGIVHCSSNKMPPQICRRPNDMVVDYTLKDGTKAYVKIPANKQYRFRISATPTTCEIVN